MVRSSLAAILNRCLFGQWSVSELNSSSFCRTWRAAGPTGTAFVKTIPSRDAHVLEAEADGLRALAAAEAIRVPAVLACESDEATGQTILALEWLEFAVPGAAFGERLGHALASLHAPEPVEGRGRFGWRRDNMIGGTQQRNTWSDQGGRAGWLQFVRTQRLLPMQKAIADRRGSRSLIVELDRVIDEMPRLFERYEPRPSLVHGDLWSGNWSMLADGTPVIFDPAVSCSDAETDLAMMELFGAPPPGFWDAYRAGAPLADDYHRRRPLYQLYHLLNHIILFGDAYADQAQACARAVRV